MRGDATHEDPQWFMRAACRGDRDPDAWYSTGKTPEEKTRVRRAKRTCAVCPVIDQCEAYAERTKQAFGIWGGKRRNLRGEVSGHIAVARERFTGVRTTG